MPAFIRFYLGEEPLLQNVETYRLEDDDVRDEVLRSLASSVVKPVDGSGGKGIIIGPQADEKTLAKTAAAVAESPRFGSRSVRSCSPRIRRWSTSA